MKNKMNISRGETARVALTRAGAECATFAAAALAKREYEALGAAFASALGARREAARSDDEAERANEAMLGVKRSLLLFPKLF